MRKTNGSKPVTHDELKSALSEFGKAIQKDINELGVAIINGVSKQLEQYATKDDFKKLETKVDGLENKVDSMHMDVRDIKRRTGDLEADAAPVLQVVDHERRLKKLEKHVFSTV